MSAKDPKPEIMRLEEVAILVKNGEIKLPKFQRPFVWRPEEMLKLLDSIYKGYPIGSILIWNSTRKLTSERNIAGLNVNVNDNEWFPTNYLLDGQQRLTTLCGALFWDGDGQDSIWNINFKLDGEEFVYPKEPGLVNLFPLNKLINTSDFIRQCMKFEHHPNKDQYVGLAEKLLRAIKDYKIAVVKIGDMTIEEVAPIFERINSTGRKLTMVDLMMAATWGNGFDLANEIKEIQDSLLQGGFGEVDDQLILRSISAASGYGVNKDDIQRLRSKDSESLGAACKAAGRAISAAMNFLRETGIEDVSYLPYGLQLTHLAEFFRVCPDPSVAQLSEILGWLWFTSVTRYFAGASTGQTSKDLSMVRGFARNDQKILYSREKIDISKLLFDKFNLKNASSTAFASLLNSVRPDCTIDGKPLDGGHSRIKSSKFFASLSPVELRSLNIAKIIFPYPISSINFLKIGNEAAHMLSVGAIDAVEADDATAFVSVRGALIANIVSSLTGCEVEFQDYKNQAKRGGDELEDEGDG